MQGVCGVNKSYDDQTVEASQLLKVLKSLVLCFVQLLQPISNQVILFEAFG